MNALFKSVRTATKEGGRFLERGYYFPRTCNFVVFKKLLDTGNRRPAGRGLCVDRPLCGSASCRRGEEEKRSQSRFEMSDIQQAPKAATREACGFPRSPADFVNNFEKFVRAAVFPFRAAAALWKKQQEEEVGGGVVECGGGLGVDQCCSTCHLETNLTPFVNRFAPDRTLVHPAAASTTTRI